MRDSTVDLYTQYTTDWITWRLWTLKRGLMRTLYIYIWNWCFGSNVSTHSILLLYGLTVSNDTLEGLWQKAANVILGYTRAASRRTATSREYGMKPVIYWRGWHIGLEVGTLLFFWRGHFIRLSCTRKRIIFYHHFYGFDLDIPKQNQSQTCAIGYIML